MKKSIVLLLVTVLVLSLAGCKKDTKLDTTTNNIYVRKDNTVTGIYVDSFEKETYRLDELKKEAQNEVAAYNKEKSGVEKYENEGKTEKLPISIRSIEAKNEKATVMLDFASGDDYFDYNNFRDYLTDKGGTTFYTSQISDSNIKLEGNFVTATGEKTSVDTINEKSNYSIIYLDFGSKVQVNGEIAYVSDNVTVKSVDTAETRDNMKSFIIYK